MNKININLWALGLCLIFAGGTLTYFESYKNNEIVDIATYFLMFGGAICIFSKLIKGTIVDRDCEVVFWIDNDSAPYVITKPLHHTQKLLRSEHDGQVFSIKVIMNFELERELLGFGAKMRVLGPRVLVKQIKAQLNKTLENYKLSKEGESAF